MIIPQSRKQAYTARIAAFCAAGAAILLLVYTECALAAASDALHLWWTRVLPSLFPFYVLTSWLFRLGVFDSMQRYLRGAFLPCLLPGIAAGNPTGARVCVALGHEEYAALCSLCSPMFLLGAVAVGLCGNADMFWPVAVAHYGSALLLWPLCRRLSLTDLSVQNVAKAPPSAPAGSAFSDIGNGMLTMLQIGGCIVFFYVIADTALQFFIGDRFPLLSAAVTGLMEMTAGAARIASLPLPPQVTAGMLAFVLTFGGLCVFSQIMVVSTLRRPGMYLLWKLMQACLAGILAYLLAPLFLGKATPAWSENAEIYAGNALIGLTFLLSAGVGLTATYLMALLMKRTRAVRPGSRGSVNNRRPRPRRHHPR